MRLRCYAVVTTEITWHMTFPSLPFPPSLKCLRAEQFSAACLKLLDSSGNIILLQDLMDHIGPESDEAIQGRTAAKHPKRHEA